MSDQGGKPQDHASSSQSDFAMGPEFMDLSAAFWRRIALVFLTWTLLIGLSMGAALNGDSRQSQRLSMVAASAAASGDRHLQDQVATWQGEITRSSMSIVTLHGVCWLLGAA